MLRLVVTAAVLATLALPAPAPARRGTVPPGFVGATADGPMLTNRVNLGHELGLMAQAGVESVRVAFQWSQAQPYASFSEVPAGAAPRFTDVGGVPTDFSVTDRLVTAAAARRLTVLPVILYSPTWAAALKAPDLVSPPSEPSSYAAYAAALAGRYGPRGEFWRSHPRLPRLPIHYWQIWNEPNIRFYWPQPFDDGYTALLKASHDAIKAIDPRAQIVAAGLPNDSWNALVHLYVAGAGPYFDVAAIHPYTNKPKGLVPMLNLVRKTMAKFGDARKPLMITEYGWPSAKGKIPALGFNEVTEPVQARRVTEALGLLASLRGQYRILGSYWYTWLSTDRGNYYFDYSGLRKWRSGRARSKPAYAAFRSMALRLEGCRSKLRADRCAR